MMKWKKNKETLNLNDPVKTLLPKRAPTINLEYDFEQKGIDLPNVISNSPYLIGKPFYNPFEVEVFNKNNGNLKRLNLNPNDVKNTDLFVRLEEKLYDDFPEFKNYETYFEVKTKKH